MGAELLAPRAGRVLWRGPGDTHQRPARPGDGVLLRGRGGSRDGWHSMLRLVDAETGARAD
ncbi:hypothetical protein ABTY61_29035 [Kitasatospora sp. NPDC096128]|uniref:hypothetical protein n=1 Tax=Kitasatospora sp. NPDC096128 TaxID=3155547 RepID=UPI00331D635D